MNVQVTKHTADIFVLQGIKENSK